MKRVELSELGRHLGLYLERLRKGQSLLLLDHGRPLALVHPLSNGGRSGTKRRRWKSDAEWLEDAERRGVLKRGTGQIPWEVLNPPTLGKGAGLVQALLEEREESW